MAVEFNGGAEAGGRGGLATHVFSSCDTDLWSHFVNWVVHSPDDSLRNDLQQPYRLTVDRLTGAELDGCERIVIVSHGNCDLLHRQITRLIRNGSADSQIIRTGPQPPGVFVAGLPEAMRRLAQPLLGDELICLSMGDLRAAAAGETVGEIVLRTSLHSTVADELSLIHHFPEIGPGKERFPENVLNRALQAALVQSSLDSLQRECVRAGVFLLWNCLDCCHRIVQEREGEGSARTADYWHAIMHRREPDLQNAAYWFRSVGRHPAYEWLRRDLETGIQELHIPEEVATIARSWVLRTPDWDPKAMLELCRTALRDPGTPADFAARAVQYLEMLNLLKFSVDQHSQR